MTVDTTELRRRLAKTELPWQLFLGRCLLAGDDHDLAIAAVNALPELLDRIDRLEEDAKLRRAINRLNEKTE